MLGGDETVAGSLGAARLAKQMDTKVAEEFSVEQLREQGLEDVDRFLANTIGGEV